MSGECISAQTIECPGGSSGAVLMELALCIHIIVILGFGMVDCSLGLDEHAAMRSAAHSGALAAARVSTSSGQEITDVAVAVSSDFLARSGLNPSIYRITVFSPTSLFGTGENSVKIFINRIGGLFGYRWLGFTSCASSEFRTNSLIRAADLNLPPPVGC